MFKERKSLRSSATAAAGSGLSSLDPEAPEKRSPPAAGAMNSLMAFFVNNWFLIGVAVSILMAKAAPEIGAKDGPLMPELTVKYGAVSLIFVISGLSLRTSQLTAAVRNVSLHVFVQGFTMGFIPIVFYLFIIPLLQVITAIRYGRARARARGRRSCIRARGRCSNCRSFTRARTLVRTVGRARARRFEPSAARVRTLFEFSSRFVRIVGRARVRARRVRIGFESIRGATSEVIHSRRDVVIPSSRVDGRRDTRAPARVLQSSLSPGAARSIDRSIARQFAGLDVWLARGLMVVGCMPPPVSSAVILTKVGSKNIL